MQELFFTGLGGHDWMALHDVSSLACASPKAPSSTERWIVSAGGVFGPRSPLWGAGEAASGRMHQAEEEEIKEILGVVSSFFMGCPCLSVWATLALGVHIGPKWGARLMAGMILWRTGLKRLGSTPQTAGATEGV